MEKMDRRKKYLVGKKTLQIAVNEALYEDFKKQLANDKLTAKEVLETAIYRYIHGDFHVNKGE